MTHEGAPVQLQVRGERAVLISLVDQVPRPAEPHEADVGPELAEALHEWARVASALGHSGSRGEGQAAAMVSQRGRQLAGRTAAALGGPVSYLDPVTGSTLLVRPAERGARHPAVARLRGALGGRSREPTPWATGLTVAAFFGVVVAVAMLALASTLAAQTTGWLAVLAAVVVTAGLAPSLWLGRRQPIVRWLVLGAVAGLAVSWVGVVFIAI